MTEQILELFEQIAKPTDDGVFGEKEKAIEKWLLERNIPYEYTPGIGMIINKQETPEKIVVSHIDLITPFKTRFQKGESFIRTKVFVQGALDNTITNAIALLAIENNLDKGTELVLTEGEESGLTGMREYLKVHKDRVKNSIFINLDVTNEGWGYDASVEYDNPYFEILKEIQKALKEFRVFYTPNRFCDDTDAINAAGNHGFSYCLPTEDIIHSFRNKALLATLTPYFNGLVSLIQNLKMPKQLTKINSYELISYLDKDFLETEIEKDELFHELHNFLFQYAAFNTSAISKIDQFLYKHYINKEPFNKEDLKELVKEKDIEEILKVLLQEKIISEENDTYKFRG